MPAALADYADDFQQRTGITCTVQANSSMRLEASLETILYRVAQEALTNVRKHARATCIEISLVVRDGKAQLQVNDDGVGFDVARTHGQAARDHFGLASMHQRVQMAGGAWEIRSHPGRGTAVTATLPIAD